MSKYQIPPALTTSLVPAFSSLVFALLLGWGAYFHGEQWATYWPLYALSGGLVGLCVGVLSELNVTQKVGQYEGNLLQLAIIWGANRGALLGACMALFILFSEQSFLKTPPMLFIDELLGLIMNCAGVIAVAAWLAVSRRARRQQFWDPGRGKTIFFSMLWGVFTCALINFGIQLDLREWAFEPQSLGLFLGLGALAGGFWGSLKPL